MITLTRYAIRHRPTGGYLAVALGRSGRGGSHEEPMIFTNDTRRMIRTWATERGAKSTLGMWLKGKFMCHRTGEDHDYEEDTTIIPVPHRKMSEMEVITVQIFME